MMRSKAKTEPGLRYWLEMAAWFAFVLVVVLGGVFVAATDAPLPRLGGAWVADLLWWGSGLGLATLAVVGLVRWLARQPSAPRPRRVARRRPTRAPSERTPWQAEARTLEAQLRPLLQLVADAAQQSVTGDQAASVLRTTLQRLEQDAANAATFAAQRDAAQALAHDQAQRLQRLGTDLAQERAARRADQDAARQRIEQIVGDALAAQRRATKAEAEVQRLRDELTARPAALDDATRAAFWASVNYGKETLPDRWQRRIEQRLGAELLELRRTEPARTAEPLPSPAAPLSATTAATASTTGGGGERASSVRRSSVVRRGRRRAAHGLPRAARKAAP